MIDETEMAQNIFQFSFDEKFQMVNSYDELIQTGKNPETEMLVYANISKRARIIHPNIIFHLKHLKMADKAFLIVKK